MKQRPVTAGTAFGSDAALRPAVAADAEPYKVADGNGRRHARRLAHVARARLRRCHGARQDGVGPSLLERMRRIDKAEFKPAVLKGNPEKGVMPPWTQEPNVNKYFEELWSYLKGRRRRAAARPPEALKEVDSARAGHGGRPAAAPRRLRAGRRGPLQVCADPNNLPFSNRNEQGFENKLAEIWARELGSTLEYTWFPQRRGFERNTLRGANDPDRYKCDLVIGVPDGYELAMTTRPTTARRTRSSTEGEGARRITVPEDLLKLAPAKLKSLSSASSHAALRLAAQASRLYDQMVPYSTPSGDPERYPGKIIENELLAGTIDVAFVWGPIAGYFARNARTPCWWSCRSAGPGDSVRLSHRHGRAVRRARVEGPGRSADRGEPAPHPGDPRRLRGAAARR